MESWNNVTHKYDAHIQWIEYSLLTDVREMTSLRHGCTHTADWLEPTANECIKVALKQIVISDTDFHQVNYFNNANSIKYALH